MTTEPKAGPSAQHNRDAQAESSYLARPGQTLSAHLNNVSNLASHFAEAFGAGREGALLGLCHDLGKYSREFQEKLRAADKSRMVDHATAGAREIARNGETYVRTLAYATIGHHSGMPDTGSAVRGFECRMNKTIPEYNNTEINIDFGLPQPKIKDMFSLQFRLRMLFSCLVDADRLDAGQKEASARGLKGFLDKIPRFDDDSEINKRRGEIRRQCLDAAEMEPGIYTLTAPTGSGKTISSLAFALKHAERHGLRRVIYAIPYTSIIEQTSKTFKSIFDDDAVLEHHSNYAFEDKAANSSDDREEHELHTENWDAPIVVTTNVQFFESLFSNRPGRCRKIHNISKSVVILDEAQMLPVPFLAPCRRALSELAENYGCTVVLMSATQPPNFPEAAEIIKNHAEIEKSFSRTEIIRLGKKSDDEILPELAKERQALVIVNTKAHARALCEKLGPGTCCLTTNLCPKHRTKILEEVKRKLKAGDPVKVVSTQLVEAGVDIDFPAVWRAACGLDSLAQAAGRCNREGKLEKPGRVHSFESTEEKLRGYLQRTAVQGGLALNLADYFRRLYANEDNDTKNIIGLLEKTAMFFETVSDLFKLIEDDGVPVIVPFDEEAERLIEKLSFAPSKETLRKLRPYTVNVQREAFPRLATRNIGDFVNVLDISDYDLITGVKDAYGAEAVFV
jgi:CRISPR-associated endonuclease/helicase Cas3